MSALTMARHFGIVAAAAMLAGCATTTSTTTGTPPSTATTAPQSMSRAEAITWARGIDPCALLDRDTLASMGAVSAYGTSSSSTACAAHVDDRTSHGVDMRWSIAFVPTDFATAPLGTLEEIDGVRVRKIDPAAALPPEMRGQLVESACSVDLALENAIAVRMLVSTHRDRNACTTGRQLVPAVLSAWREHSRQGRSPNTTVTVLTVAAPCAVVPDLQKARSVAFDWNDQSLNTCFFKLDGNGVLVSLDYRPRDQISLGSPATFGGHAGHREVSGSTTFDRVVVGAEFTGVDAGHEARLVPVVEVSGDNADAVSDVMTATLKQLPV
ncbi:DUF3558 family protein [Mycolicibacterium llatzerense]|uniref:DUF3558 family protein n=1 Tax=Mycolicibacterium llatzerense TaxID=280871 RepID=UPI000B31380A|nr:DUF3558 family protein [Mycolicibacterium llatzerense]